MMPILKLKDVSKVNDAVDWLKNNVGALINWDPYDKCTFYGDGWSVYGRTIRGDYHGKKDIMVSEWVVDIEDEQKATLFGLQVL
jgi:hypothetical protein